MLGGNLASTPSAVSWGRLDVFGTNGEGGQLAHWWWDNDWREPELLGGDTMAPAAVSWGFERLDVFGSDAASNQLAHWWWDGAWRGPELLGGRLLTAPSVVAWAPLHFRVIGSAGSFDVFGVDIDTNQLSHWRWNGGWTGPDLLAGNLASAPSAVSWAPDRIDVFGVDNGTQQLAHWWWDNEWNGPELLGGTLQDNTSPSAVAWGPERLDVFGIDGQTGQLAHWWWSP